MRYYKVLKNGKSFHGGYMAWPLLVGDNPGEWVKHNGDISPCQSGLHVTTEPARWMAVGADVFEVEISGEIMPCDAPDKFVCRELRLIKKLSESELIPLNVFSSGTHEIRNVYAFCCGSSAVYAYGSIAVYAYGSSAVYAYRSSTVVAYGSSAVYANGSSAVYANGSSTVYAYGSSTVVAYGSSTVYAYGSSCVTIKSKSARFTCNDYAVVIDRSNDGMPVVKIGDGLK